jgi:hypothetical protein
MNLIDLPFIRLPGQTYVAYPYRQLVWSADDQIYLIQHTHKDDSYVDMLLEVTIDKVPSVRTTRVLDNVNRLYHNAAFGDLLVQTGKGEVLRGKSLINVFIK